MLNINNLAKQYGDKTALHGLNIQLPEGEVLGLLGRNGAGKTTTIKMLLNLIPPTKGDIHWKSAPLNRNSVKIGYLPEERGLYPKIKIKDQLAYFGELEGMNKKDIKDSIDYWLNRFEIMEHKNKLASELSKGNQQKVQIISTLLHNPDLIILDEPFSGLDPVNANMLSSIISELMVAKKTIILSSHRMEQIEKFVQHVCLLKDGQAIANGRLKDIKKEYGYRTLKLDVTEEILNYLSENQVHYTIEDTTLLIQFKTENEAIRLLHSMSEAAIELLNFAFLEPSLHDIFIERMR